MTAIIGSAGNSIGTTPTPPATERGLPLAAWIAPALALALWIVSLFQIDLSGLGPWGLLPQLSLLWYLGLALAVAGCVYGLVLRRGRGPHVAFMATNVGVLIAVLFATASIIEAVPRRAWTYKHLGVTNYILQNGTYDSSVDIYQRWPGGFGLGAYISELLGIQDPTSIARWAQPLFAVMLALLIYALVRTVTASATAPWIAVIVFTITNWTGQLYYAPQPLALSMHLAIMILVLRVLRTSPNRFGLALSRVMSGKSVHPDRPLIATAGTPASRGLTIAAVLLMQIASAVSHQLTPYMTVLAVGVLLVLGFIRSWAVVVALVAIPVLYLIPNLEYVQQNYSLFNSLNPFANFRPRTETVTQLLDTKAFLGWLAPVLCLAVGALTAIGVIVQWRWGRRSLTVMLSVLAISPLALGFLQNYGGEAQLRAFLFASPWCVAIIGLLGGNLLTSKFPTWMKAAALSGTFAVLLTIFVPMNFGNEDVYYIPQSEVAACQWLSTNAPAGSVYVQSVSGFPARCAADYAEHVGPSRGDTPTLMSAGADFAKSTFTGDTTAATDRVWDRVRGYGKTALLVFSTSQQAYARAQGLFGGEAGYQRMEQAVATSGRFALVYANTDARVYALVL